MVLSDSAPLKLTLRWASVVAILIVVFKLGAVVSSDRSLIDKNQGDISQLRAELADMRRSNSEMVHVLDSMAGRIEVLLSKQAYMQSQIDLIQDLVIKEGKRARDDE